MFSEFDFSLSWAVAQLQNGDDSWNRNGGLPADLFVTDLLMAHGPVH